MISTAAMLILMPRSLNTLLSPVHDGHEKAVNWFKRYWRDQYTQTHAHDDTTSLTVQLKIRKLGL